MGHISPFVEIVKQPNTSMPVEKLVDEVVKTIPTVLNLDSPIPYTLSIRFSDDAEVQELNNQFRGKDKPTNVLSFPGDEAIPGVELTEEYIGDIIVSCDTMAREAEEQGKKLDDHFKHLVLHGVLHLLGYDHIEDDEAEEMEALEAEILTKMGVNNPYVIIED